MRVNLAPYLGQLVMATGYIDKWSDSPKGGLRYLFTDLEVKPYLKEGRTVYVDHMWIYYNDIFDHKHVIGSPNITRLSSCLFLGYVLQYKRVDGTIDYGIERFNTITLNPNSVISTANRMFNCKQYRSLTNMLQELLEGIESGSIICPYPFEYDYKKGQLEVKRFVESIRRHYQSANKAYTSALKTCCKRSMSKIKLPITSSRKSILEI